MAKDNLYQHQQSPVPSFQFDEQVAKVFDDMIHRSIPFYREIILRQAQLIEHYYQPGMVIYDMGCSNGNLGMQVCRLLGDRPFKMIAIDKSPSMIEVYQKRLEQTAWANKVALHCQDICTANVELASIVVLNFTLQFVRPQERDAIISGIYNGLNSGGAFLFSEKVIHKDKMLNSLQQEFYCAFKRENGYSDLEISQKREALDNVLIPETLEQHLNRLQKAGFKAIDVWQKWFNFAAMISIKS